jgi:uncharacterized protein YecT (DUF1311 family)
MTKQTKMRMHLAAWAVGLAPVVSLGADGDATNAAKPARDYEAEYQTCLASAGTTNNASVMQCAEKTLKDAKAELNTLYSVAHSSIAKRSASDAMKFERSQKAWLSYRNGTCELAASYVGSPMVSYCPMRVTIQRVAEMRELAPR